MDKIADFAYVLAGIFWPLLFGFGCLVLTLTPARARFARIWLVLSALPAAAALAAFGITEMPRNLAIIGAAIPAFLLGVCYCALNEYINEQIENAPATNETPVVPVVGD